ncbi:MAG: MAPEG family protein [Gammaproteobacteria bacterium]|nr:MAPEG family protein [Gammaproteobacteria bacterium]
MMTQLPLTSIFSFCFAVLIFYLVLQVVRCRRKFRVGYGDGGHDELRHAISAHSNAIETIPLALIILLISELNAVNSVLLISASVLFLLARIIHVIGLMSSLGTSFGRTYGTLASWLFIIFLALVNLFYAFQ